MPALSAAQICASASVCLLLSPGGSATPLRYAPVLAETGVPALMASVGAERKDVTECAEVSELAGAYLCCSATHRRMSEAFTRLDLFMGAWKGHPRGTLLAADDPELEKYRGAAGHNFPGQVLREFAAAAQDTTPAEREVLDVFAGPDSRWRFGERFYLVSIPVGDDGYGDSVSHELLHAQFLLSEGVKDAVERFWWQGLTDDERALVRKQLGEADYNTADDRILIDEFQAYLLMQGAENYPLAPFVTGKEGRRDLRSMLLKELSSTKYRPLTIR